MSVPVGKLTQTPEVVQYESVIPWPLLQKHLEQKVKEQNSRLRGAKDLESMYKAQGALVVLEHLLNLPGTLTVLEVK